MITQVEATDFRVTVVGCSGSYPGPDSPASCYLVQAESAGRTWNLVVDLGNGALGGLQRYIDPLKVDAVLLSHLHADHCIDMTSYYVLRKYHPTGTQPKIPVWGPSDTPGRLSRAYDLPMNPGMREEFEFYSFPDKVRIGPFEVDGVPVDHPVEAYAMRITVGDKVLAYSGDTGPVDALLQVADRADLFLAEASFEEGKPNPPSLHLTGREVGEYASKAEVKRLVLTHVPPWHDPRVVFDEARSMYDGPIALASMGAVYRL